MQLEMMLIVDILCIVITWVILKKTTGLFDKEKDILSKDDVNNSKKLFELAQKK